MLRNEKGSIMTVAVVMIALLSFSLTSLTAYTFRTSENTNRVVEENSDDSRAKRLVSEALSRFQSWMHENVEDKEAEEEGSGIDWFQNLDINSDDDVMMETIEDDLDVSMRLAEEKYDDPDTLEGVSARAYRIAYPVSDSREIVRYIYFTDYGVEYEEFNAFTYSMGSSQNVVLNGGEYLQSADVYGSRIYNGFSTAYKDSNGDYQVVEAGTYNYPSGDDATFTAPHYHECETSVSCLYTDSESKLVVNADNYTEIEEETDGEFFSDLFMGFDFDTMYYNKLALLLDDEEGSVEEENYQNFLTQKKETSILSTRDGDISGTDTLTLDNNYLVEGSATIDLGANNLELNDHTLIIDGDLTIDSVQDIHSPGQIYVFGDVHIQNNRDLEMTANLFTNGEILVNFDEGFGFNLDSGQSKDGMGLFAKGNILFRQNMTTPKPSGARMSLFILSESSIVMDSAVQQMAFGGAVYAQGKGDGISDVLIENDGTLETFKGLLVNSYYGTIDPDTGDATPGDTTEDGGGGGQGNGNGNPGNNPGGGGPPSHSNPGSQLGEHSFSFNALDESTAGNSPSENLEESFSDLPDFERLIVIPSDGEIVDDSSTYIYEALEEE